MIEYFTEAIVLRRINRGEQDGNIILYTKDLGKISVFAKSIRKTTSKISGHMVPGNIVKTRIIEKNNIQAVDVLGDKSNCDSKRLLDFVYFLDGVIPFGVPDIPLWHGIKSVLENCDFKTNTYAKILEILGFISEDSKCNICKKNEIVYFLMADIICLCEFCKNKVTNKDSGIIIVKE